MSIKQHFARWKETEAAKLRPMTAKQRAGYILHYYRFWFIGLALLLLVGFYIGDAVIQSHKEILLQGFFTNDEYNLFPAERIEKDYAATQTLTRQQRIVFDDALYIDLGGRGQRIHRRQQRQADRLHDDARAGFCGDQRRGAGVLQRHVPYGRPRSASPGGPAGSPRG